MRRSVNPLYAYAPAPAAFATSQLAILAASLSVGSCTAQSAPSSTAAPRSCGRAALDLALLPADAAGMASAITVITRQGGFAIGVPMLGAAMPSGQTASGFVGVFAIAAAVSALGAAACVLLPREAKAQT